VAVAGVVLTIIGQGIVERVDLRGVFEAQPGPGHPTTFPATLPLAGAVFAAMLQLSLVSEGWPLQRFRRPGSGVLALATSWVVALVAYELVVSVDAVPPEERAALDLHNPGGRDWTRATPDDWVTTAALTFIGAGVILHVAIGGRWPLALAAQPQDRA
jgi:hypothetical protein